MPPTGEAHQIDALRADEVGRINAYARLMTIMGVIGIPVIPLLDGDPFGEKLLMSAVAVVVVTYAVLYWLSCTIERYNDDLVAVLSQIQCLAAHGALYFFGVFSPFAAIVGVGIYVYSLGGRFRHALIAYLNLAGGYVVLGTLMVTDVLVDRGLVHAEYLPVREQLVIIFCVQVVYGLAFLVGRLSRRRTVESLAQLEHAIRDLAQREAMLSEARAELDRSAWVGNAGRYTDQVLGSYRLGELIGRGAMGEVYAAQPTGSGPPAAVKLLHRGALDGQPEHLARFVREVQVAATIAHPNVVRFLEVGGEASPVPYLAMERLEGQDLAQLLRERRALHLGEVIDMVEQVAAGLEAARRAGIVHRDLKPQNLFLQDGQTWKVLDFGVSKLAADTQTLTRGLVVGTPAYMAPEQAAGREVDHRADVYSLAVIAYRAITGHPAFTGHRVPQVLYDVVHKMPARPGSLTGIPDEVDAVLAIGMAKRPADRFERAGELATALTAAARGDLDPELRRRAERIVGRRPWGSVR